MSGLEEAARWLQVAIAAGSYQEAEKLAEEYARQVEEELRRLPILEPAAVALCSETRELFERARRAVHADRACANARLERLAAARFYRRPPRPRARLAAEG